MPEEIIEILNSLASESKSRVKAGEIIKIGNFRSTYNDEDTDHADGESDVDLDHYAPVIIEPIRVDGDLIDVDPLPIEADEYIEDDHTYGFDELRIFSQVLLIIVKYAFPPIASYCPAPPIFLTKPSETVLFL